MAEILIHHCTLRLVRHSGWSWGPDPRGLVKAAKDLLPQLIAHKLAHLWPGDTNVEITAPIRITVPLQLHELLESRYDPVSKEPVLSANKWIEVLEKKLIGAFQAMPTANYQTSHVLPEKAVAIAKASTEPPKRLSRNTLLSVLLGWRQQGFLVAILRSSSLHALEVWHTALLRPSTQPELELAGESAESLRALVCDLATSLDAPVLDRETCIRHRILVVVEIASQLDRSPPPRMLRASLDDPLPLKDLPTSESRQALDSTQSPTLPSSSIGETAKTMLEAQSTPLQHGPAPLLEGERYVASALPFLVLGVLSRLGYVDALKVTLEAADLAGESALFAMGLAYKVLDPPQRGWNRNAATIQAAATFAGLDSPAQEPALAAFQHKATDLISTLDAFITQILINGHNTNRPLLLHAITSFSKNEFLLVDTEGFFPIAWLQSIEVIARLIKDCGPVTIIIPQESAGTRVLRELNANKLKFVTDAPPVRGEQWRELRVPQGPVFWTNDHEGSALKLIKAGCSIPELSMRVKTIVQEFSFNRTAVTLGQQTAIEHSLALAAGVALADIAWTLWGESETTSPLLALERFGDLDARARFNAQSVRVRLPLGRRHRDLHEHGLLVDVHNVPWLNGRVLEFSGG